MIAALQTSEGVGPITGEPAGHATGDKTFVVDCFIGPKDSYTFPEHSYDVGTIEEVKQIVADASKPGSGIALVQVWIK